MSNYKPYPAYKDSGSEWLGAVPEHWEVKRLQHLCSNIKAGPFGSALTKDMYEREGFRIYGQEQVIPGDFSVGDYYISSELYSRLRQYEVRAGDILISCVGTFGKIAVAPNGIEPGIINPRLIRVRVNDTVTPDYLSAVMQSSVVFEQFSHQSRGGTMDVINIGTLSGIVISVPPRLEQAAMLRFLERETARIDALIEKKSRFIELLREKRQALITHVITKGLDPNVRMKDSGVEWLGEMPEHWVMRSFKHLACIRYGIGEPPVYKTEGTPLIRATNVDAGSLCSKGLVYVDPKDIPDKRIIWLTPGDIIVVRSGAYTGDSAIIREYHCPAIAGFDMVVSPQRVNPFFLQYALLSRYLKSNQIDLEKMRAAQPHLNAEELGACFVLVPPTLEQETIVEFLDQSTKRVDGVISKTLLSIELLKERRSALITAAVTGQIDLREAV